jgi:hypothetical protein
MSAAAPRLAPASLALLPPHSVRLLLRHGNAMSIGMMEVTSRCINLPPPQTYWLDWKDLHHPLQVTLQVSQPTVRSGVRGCPLISLVAPCHRVDACCPLRLSAALLSIHLVAPRLRTARLVRQCLQDEAPRRPFAAAQRPAALLPSSTRLRSL